MESLYLVGLAVLAVFAFVIVIVVSKYFMTWLRARIANAPVSIGKMIGMSLRKVPVGLIVDNRITAVKAGLDVRSDPLEAHYLAGGDVGHVVLALIAADKAGISLDFNRACAIDLATKGTARPCWKRCARASIRKSSTHRTRQWVAQPSTASHRTESV